MFFALIILKNFNVHPDVNLYHTATTDPAYLEPAKNQSRRIRSDLLFLALEIFS
jgi:hypothetical protein